jgi:IS605 OrfB family transposase
MENNKEEKNISKTMIICRKIALYPIGDEEEVNKAYKFIRDGQKAQNNALNLMMSQLMTLYYKYNCNENNADYKKEKKELFQKSYYDSLYTSADITFATGVDSQSQLHKKVQQDFKTALNNGLRYGERSINNYKSDVPLLTRGRDIKFKHDYENDEEFLNHLYKKDLSLRMEWVHKIKFKVILDNGKNFKKSFELRSILQKVMIDKIYQIKGSSIGIDGNKIILNLSLEIPKSFVELDENTVVGVDLGINIPAYCATNNTVANKPLGDKEDFLKVRTQLQKQKRRFQRNLKNSKGGHGRNKKLKALEVFNKKERNYVNTYNHMISKRVVDFALRNKAKYINVENLEGYNTNDFVLRNWSYYQLQTQIEYKAAKYGIELRKVNPYHTSQICSSCGHWEEGQRNGKNFECKACGTKINADLNAARNIALSTNIVYANGEKVVKEKSTKKKSKKTKTKVE